VVPGQPGRRGVRDRRHQGLERQLGRRARAPTRDHVRPHERRPALHRLRFPRPGRAGGDVSGAGGDRRPRFGGAGIRTGPAGACPWRAGARRAGPAGTGSRRAGGKTRRDRRRFGCAVLACAGVVGARTGRCGPSERTGRDGTGRRHRGGRDRCRVHVARCLLIGRFRGRRCGLGPSRPPPRAAPLPGRASVPGTRRSDPGRRTVLVVHLAASPEALVHRDVRPPCRHRVTPAFPDRSAVMTSAIRHSA
jgi:hypothetical protein